MYAGLIIGLAIAATTVGVFYYYQTNQKGRVKKFDLSGAKSEIIDGEIRLDDVVDYLKSQKLSKDVHIPFIASYKEGTINSLKIFFENINDKEGYQILLIGIFDNNTEELSDIKILYGRSFDPKLCEIIGNAPLIVLE